MNYIRNLSKKTIAVMVAMLIVLSSIVSAMVVVSANSVDVWDGTMSSDIKGSGTEADPYLIENAEQLAYVSGTASNSHAAKYLKLVNDIYINDITNANWKETAIEWVAGNVRFSGTLDGDGHTIYGLYITKKNSLGRYGLFAYSGAATASSPAAVFKNIKFSNAYINVTESVEGIGIVVGQGSGSTTFEKVYIDETCYLNAPEGKGVAGLIARGPTSGVTGYTTTIKDCAVLASIAGKTYVGALTGTFWRSSEAIKAEGNFSSANIPLFGQCTPTPTNANNYGLVADTYNSTVITADQMKGEAAKTNMPGLNWKVWKTTENSYPVPNDEIVIEAWDGTKSSSFAGGTGTQADPYLIDNASQLAYVATTDLTNGLYFKLVKDIYINDTTNPDWKATAKEWVWADVRYVGTLDGAGHTIHGLYITKKQTRMGIFSYVGDSTFKNIKFSNAYISVAEAVEGVGLIAGQAQTSTKFENIYVDESCEINAPEGKGVAALIARGPSSSPSGFTITANNCAVLAKIVGKTYAGALTGTFWRSAETIKANGCFTSSDVPLFGQCTATSNCANNYAVVSDTYGTTVLTADQMKGTAAKTNMPGLNWTNVFETSAGYPVMNVKNDGVTPEQPEQPEEPKDDYLPAEKFAGGKGTPSEPYLISNASELYYLVTEVSKANNADFTKNKYFKITNDIYLNDVQDGTPVQNLTNPKSWGNNLKAPDTSARNFFYGTLDGGGHVIYGMYVYNYINPGLFGAIANGSTVKNLGFENFYFEGGAGSAGALAGYANWAGLSGSTAKISNCYVKNATMVAGSSNKLANAGGFIGNASNATIEFSNCYAYNLNLSGSTCNASMIGKKTTEATVKVYNSYFVGYYPVTKTGNGHNKVKYYNVYTDQDIVAKDATDADEVIAKLTLDQMKGAAAKTNMAGFNFEMDWATVENGFPVLREGAGEWNYDHTKKGEVWSGLLSAYYASGSGTKADPYIIETGGQLALLANDALNGKTTGLYYKITADIILNDTSKDNWTATANEWYIGKWAQAFRGYLDGGYHTISGLYLNKTKETYTGPLYYGGLFAAIGKGAVIEKLGIVNANMTFTHDTETKYLGAFAGFVDQYNAASSTYEEYPIIRECFADTTVYLDGGSCGGFIGCATRPIRIENSFFTGKVVGTSRGLFGYSKMNADYDYVLVKNTYVADSKFAVVSNPSYDNFKYENCYSSSAQDTVGLTRIFIDRMCGELAMDYMSALDYENIWVIGGDNETPGLKGFNKNAYSNVMNPEDIVVNFETNCDLIVSATTGKAYSKLDLPVLSREGYTFEGWYAYPELDVYFDYDYFPTFNTILYAKWSLNGYQQDMEQYEDSIYDYHEGYEYYRPSSPDYTAEYVHNGAKAIHRLAGVEDNLDFLLFYREELEVGKKYKMVFYVTTDEAKAMTDLSLVHHSWPDVYCDPVDVEKMVTLKDLEDGEWVEVTYTFTAKSKWIAIRSTGKNSLFFDDFTLYQTKSSAKTSAATAAAANAKANVAFGEVKLPIANDYAALVLVTATAVMTLAGVAVVIYLKKKHSHN